MFGKKKTVTTFMFRQPFVKDVSADESVLWANNNPYPEPDAAVIEKLHNHILTWMEREELILVLAGQKGTPNYYVNHKKNTASLAYILAETSMPALTFSTYFEEFRANISADHSNLQIARIGNIPAYLGNLFPEDVINYVVHSAYQSVGFMDQTDATKTWADIHKQLPYMWVLIVINTLMQIYVRPITEKPIFEVEK